MTRLRSLCAVVLSTAMMACRASDSAAPEPGQFTGTLNNANWSGQPTVFVIPGNGDVDTLRVIGYRLDTHMDIRVPIRGRGRYTLRPDNVLVRALLGGDMLIGNYTGNMQSSGHMQVTEYGGVGGVLRAELEVTADHADGVAIFGPTFALRQGHIATRVFSAER